MESVRSGESRCWRFDGFFVDDCIVSLSLRRVSYDEGRLARREERFVEKGLEVELMCADGENEGFEGSVNGECGFAVLKVGCGFAVSKVGCCFCGRKVVWWDGEALPKIELPKGWNGCPQTIAHFGAESASRKLSQIARTCSQSESGTVKETVCRSSASMLPVRDFRWIV